MADLRVPELILICCVCVAVGFVSGAYAVIYGHLCGCERSQPTAIRIPTEAEATKLCQKNGYDRGGLLGTICDGSVWCVSRTGHITNTTCVPWKND